MQRVVGQSSRFGRLLAGLGMVIAMTITAGCAVAGVKAMQDTKNPDLWTLTNGKVDVQVSAKVGRIMHYGFVGGPNLFWTNSDPLNPKYNMGGFINYGGDKIWPWPQDYFGWPPPEPKEGYTVAVSGDGKSLVMTGTMPGYSVKVVRTIELADDTSTMAVTTTFAPEGTTFSKPIGVWSITQVPTPKELYVRVPLAADRQHYLDRQPKDEYQLKALGANVVQLTPNTAKGVKTFMDADVIAAVYDDVVLLQRQLPVHKEGIWVADQKTQVYSNPPKAESVPPGPSYTELEWTAPMLPPTRVSQAPLKVIYKAVRLSAKTTPAEIVQMIEKLP